MEEQKFYYAPPSQGNSYQDRIPREEYLQGIFYLLKESWKIYKKRIRTLLGILIIPVGFLLFLDILIYFLEKTDIIYTIWFSGVGAISFFGSAFLWFLAWPSLIFSIKDDTGIKESYQKGWKIFFSYIWVYLLFILIISGGFLLFLVPGVLFLIWFSLSVFVLVSEGGKGSGALFRSKCLVRGKFWKILWRFLILGLIIGAGLFLVFSLIYFGSANKHIEYQINEVMGYLIQLFILPFVIIYAFLIYKNLKKIKATIPCQESLKRRKIKYILPGLLGIGIIGLGISISFFNIFWGRDIPPIDDSDLWLLRVEIPLEENSFYYFKEIGEKFYLPEGKGDLFERMATGEQWDPEFAQELIENNKETFRYFEKAVALPYFQELEWQDPKSISYNTSIFGMRGIRDMVNLNLIKANYLFVQGEEEEAFDLLVKTIKMGQILQDSPRSSLIPYLLGMSVKNSGLEKLRELISDATLSSEILKNYIDELKQFEENKEGLVGKWKMEYAAFANAKLKIDAYFDGKIPDEALEEVGMEGLPISPLFVRLNYLYKPNQTQRFFVEHFRNLVNNARKNYYNEMIFSETEATPYSGIKILFTENVIGKLLRDIMMASFDGAFKRRCLEDFSVRGTQILMAFKAYQAETGGLPTNLNELIPKYFSEIPKDPFDGELIKYSAERKIIYSVGKDLQDIGGNEGGDWGAMENPTFKIKF
ncbi:hypothetical protein KJ591_01675 [Patescibacteria group bacterium]|nr:hypothetical protein [Patescibacteria group bacterium]MBU4023054.1 hypothetical protein [Patescibacteria group bacterium]